MSNDAKTYLKIACNLILFLATSALLLFALPKVLVFFMPFTVAWIIACIARPIVRFIEKRLKIKRKIGMAVTVVLIIAIIIGLIYLIGASCVKFLMNFAADLPSLWAGVRDEAKMALHTVLGFLEKFSGDSVKEVETFLSSGSQAISGLISDLSAPTISAVSNFAKRLPEIVIFAVMCILATYFFVVERENISKLWRTYMPKGVLEVWDLLKKGVVKSIGGYFKAQFKIEIWVYLLLFIGLSLLGVRYAILLALLCAFLDLLPVFGTGAILWPWALIEAINGDYVRALCLMIIWGLAQLLRQFIQPKFVGDTLGVDPITTLFLLWGGYRAWGIFGMVISVPLGILMISLYKEGVFKTVEQSIRLLAHRLTKFRKYNEEELKEIEENKKL